MEPARPLLTLLADTGHQDYIYDRRRRTVTVGTAKLWSNTTRLLEGGGWRTRHLARDLDAPTMPTPHAKDRIETYYRGLDEMICHTATRDDPKLMMSARCCCGHTAKKTLTTRAPPARLRQL